MKWHESGQVKMLGALVMRLVAFDQPGLLARVAGAAGLAEALREVAYRPSRSAPQVIAWQRRDPVADPGELQPVGQVEYTSAASSMGRPAAEATWTMSKAEHIDTMAATRSSSFEGTPRVEESLPRFGEYRLAALGQQRGQTGTRGYV
jgi:hypothetical protein